jgi:hypothetical protein
MKTPSRLLLAVVLAALPFALRAADEASPGARKSLFDGKTLAGWTLRTCEAAVDQGEILLQSGNGLVISTEKYADFILEFEWKKLAEDKWDSGVYFRFDAVPEGKPWPPRYQVNLRQGMEGNCGELKDAKSTGLVKPGEWNTFKLTVKGADASLEINGQPAWKATGLAGPAEGFIALQAEVPQGGQHRFRNIYVTKL